MFLISLFSVAYARANELLVATIEKDKVHLLDETNLQSISALQAAGILDVQDQQAQGFILTTQAGSQGQVLFEGLRQKGIVTQQETVSSSICEGQCVKN